MPVQINEVIIRAVIDPQGAAGQTSGTATPATTNKIKDGEIAEKIMEILKEKKER